MRRVYNPHARNIQREASDAAPNHTMTRVIPTKSQVARGLEDFDNLFPVCNDDQPPTRPVSSSSPSTTRISRDHHRHRLQNNNYRRRQLGEVPEGQAVMTTPVARRGRADNGGIPPPRRTAGLQEESARNLGAVPPMPARSNRPTMPTTLRPREARQQHGLNWVAPYTIPGEARQQQQRTNPIISHQVEVNAPLPAPIEIDVPRRLQRVDSGVTLPWELHEMELSRPPSHRHLLDVNDSEEDGSEDDGVDTGRRLGNFSKKDFVDDEEQFNMLLSQLKEEDDSSSIYSGRESVLDQGLRVLMNHLTVNPDPSLAEIAGENQEISELLSEQYRVLEEAYEKKSLSGASNASTAGTTVTPSVMSTVYSASTASREWTPSYYRGEF